MLVTAAPDIGWTGFRGDGRNVADVDLPLVWSDDQGIAWTSALDGYGQSSPLVWQDRLYVGSVEGANKERGILACFELKSGKKLWSAQIPATQQVPSSDMVSRGAPTPCIDGRGAYVFFESGDLAAIDHAGKLIWHRKLSEEYGSYQGNHGLGGSTAQSTDAVYVLVDHDGPSYLLAVDKATGKNLWRTRRPSKISWSSPLYVDGPTPIVVVSSSGSVEAYRAIDGKQLWSHQGVEGNTVASPTLAASTADSSAMIVVGSSDAGQTVALRYALNGAVDAQPEAAWRLSSSASSFSSPLAYRDHVYLVNKSGVAACVELADGEPLWTERLPGSCWATPLGASDRVYFFGKDGVTTVVASGPKFKRLSENRLTIEGRVYGAAAVRGAIVLRTGEKLICVGNP